MDQYSVASSAGFRIRILSDPVFLPGFGSGFQISLNPDPIFKILWIRIRFQTMDPGAKKECRTGPKRYLLEENIKIMIN